MRDKTSFLIRVISLSVSLILAAVCVALALVYKDNTAMVFTCVFGMILVICLVIPCFLIASLYDRIKEAEKQLARMKAAGDSFTSTSVISESDVARISMAAEAKVKSEKQDKKGKFSASEEITIAEVTADDHDRETSEREKSIPKYKKEPAINASEVFNRSAEERARAENEERGRRLFSETALDFPSVPVQKPEPAAFEAGMRHSAAPAEMFDVNHKTKTITRYIPRSPGVAISAGGLHTVAVTDDGRVFATGFATYGQCDVSAWRDIVGIAAGNHHTVGLRSDGTVCATGYNGYGQCDVASWRSISAVAAGVGHTVALAENGTVVACGDNTYGQCNVEDWIDIVSIAAAYNYTVGLRANGTIVACGANTDGSWAALDWGGIISIAAGGLHTVGLRSDGTLLAVGNNANGQRDVERFSNIKAVAAGNYHTAVLHSDGRVSAVGYNGFGQCNVSDWTGIVAISAGRNHTIGLRSDGTLLAVGDNSYGQCAVTRWNDLLVLE